MFVIIPAHNESAVIQATLRRLTDGLADNTMIIVACNGCTDNTHELAEQVPGPITVIESTTASKTAALNAGDEAADRIAHAHGVSGYPRAYVDADILLSGEKLERIGAELDTRHTPAAAPRPTYRLDHASLAVRLYYKLWLALPYVKDGMVGCGVYVLSEDGRGRFDEFPSVIADDGYVRSLFSSEERPQIAECEVTPPATLTDLVLIKTRSRLGLMELDERYPGQRQTTDKRSWGKTLRWLLGRPGLWASVPVYLYVNLRSRQRARQQLGARTDGAGLQWERDESSRKPTTSTV